MKPYCPGPKAHTGAPWRDLPPSFRDWARAGVYDSNSIIEEMNAHGMFICISQRPQRKEPLEIDPVMYVWLAASSGEFLLQSEKTSVGLR